VEFGKIIETKGFDINKKRVEELKKGKDSTLEVEPENLVTATKLTYTNNLEDLKDSNFFIVTVPTPVDKNKTPDLSPLISASQMLGKIIKKNDIVVYESTVYPGATEEVCIPEIEKVSGLKFNKDFFAGYSPERINPGDKEHRVTNIVKVTSGSTPETAETVDKIYKKIILAGTHKASSIKVAEASKVIENTQRDLNIALINELAIIFDKMKIDTEEVLKAAGTKWNFLNFKPGLVGGHCIGVDPYYLTFKAQEIGYHPEIILAGRRINDRMGAYVVSRVVKEMVKKKIHVHGSNILIMGLTFKENCPDLRNTKVVDIIQEFKDYNANIDIYDPMVDENEALHEYGLSLTKELKENTYDAIILAVAHDDFINMGIKKIKEFGKSENVIFDIKHVFPQQDVDCRL
jgi:UDP-N-acetyl-D-galactosamine dehydrogenase